MNDTKRTIPKDAWFAEGTRRFGPDIDNWRFVCPVCAHVASVADWRAAGAGEGAIAYSCIGRWLGVDQKTAFCAKGMGPCNYAGGGLFGFNPVRVVRPNGIAVDLFEFASERAEV